MEARNSEEKISELTEELTEEGEDTAALKREKRRKFVRTFLITLFVGAVISCAAMYAQGVFSAYQPGYSLVPQTMQERFRIASDVFFIFGVLVAGVGALRFAKNKGAFDGLTYSVSLLVWPFRLRDREPGIKQGSMPKSYYEYRQEHIAKEKTLGSGAPIILAGCVYLFLAVVTSLMYMM